MKINKNYELLEDNYLFSAIGKRVNEWTAQNQDKQIFRLGIGDVTLPLPSTIIAAMQIAIAEMGDADCFRGYGQEQGYSFLRRAICDYYAGKQVNLKEEEVFISDGAKSDLGNILDIFDNSNSVLIPDPVYPVYRDTNIMANRKIHYINACDENEFLPLPNSSTKGDIIYLCSPNNPTGAVYNKSQLQQWVNFALENNAVILFDSAYEAYIQEESLPTSIYQIPGAKECAIEFCSLSKTAGFTGTRCGYTIVPSTLIRDGNSLNKLWLRRQTTKFNGVAYIVQRGAHAVFTKKGMAEVKQNINYYMQNAHIIADTLTQLGMSFTGGHNAPYIWLKCPEGMTSREFFDYLLYKAQVVGTPGSGFGEVGEGYLRLSAFGDRQNIITAMDKISENCRCYSLREKLAIRR